MPRPNLNYEAMQSKMCAYLKNKIAQEEQESQTYHKIEADAQTLTNGHIFLDVLFDAQATEVKELKTLYKDLCEYGNLKRKPLEKLAGYAIYYYKGTDYYPASSVFGTQDIYVSKASAENLAHTLSIRNRGVEFGVYPVNENYEIIGKPVQKYGVSSRFPR